MKIKIIVSFLIFLSVGLVPVYPQNYSPVYLPGEELRYQIYYGPLTGGEVLMTLNPTIYSGKRVIHAKTVGYTTGLANRLFKVYDVYESYMDPANGLPVKSIRNISEGNYRYYNEVDYDRINNLITSSRSGVKEVPDGILDMVSAIYKLRDTIGSRIFRPNEVIELATYFGDDIYPLYIRYSGPEMIKTKLGEFHAIKCHPVSEPGRLFKSEDDITVWFSNDGNFVPLRVRMNMVVGAVRMDLIEAKGLKFPLRVTY